MLESITIRNFQRHKKLKVEFNDHITTFTGPTDAGKSAVIRALRWACINVPSGASFIRNGANECRVSIEFDEGQNLIRRRKKKGNDFIPFSITSYSGTTRDFKAVGKGNVPAEVERLLSVSPTNFQSQFDGPFWLSDSGGRISQELNKIVDLSIIDRSLSSIAHAVRKSKSAIDAFESIVNDAKEATSKSQWSVKADKQLRSIEKKQSKIKELKTRKETLIQHRDKIEKIKAFTKNIKEVLQKGKVAVDLGQQLYSLNKKKTKLIAIKKQIETLQARIEETKKQIKSITKELALVKRCPTCGKIYE